MKFVLEMAFVTFCAHWILVCDIERNLLFNPCKDVKFIGLNKRAVTKAPACSNIEKALSVVWKRGVRAGVCFFVSSRFDLNV